jgi:hypothetical protein
VLLASPDPYWLCRCEGWRVVSPAGRVGTVAGLLFGSHSRSPDALRVRAGLVRTRELVISVDAVDYADPQSRRLILRNTPESSPFASILQARTQGGRQGGEKDAGVSAA